MPVKIARSAFFASLPQRDRACSGVQRRSARCEIFSSWDTGRSIRGTCVECATLRSLALNLDDRLTIWRFPPCVRRRAPPASAARARILRGQSQQTARKARSAMASIAIRSRMRASASDGPPAANAARCRKLSAGKSHGGSPLNNCLNGRHD